VKETAAETEEAMEVRIYYEDTDAGGVVYHANYLRYFERARTEFFRERGLSVHELHEQGSIFPVVRLEVDFRAPARLDDLLRVETRVLEVGKTSFILGQQVLRASDGRLLVDAKVTLVCVGPGMKAKRLPAELLHVMAEGLEK
jgi:acyl-CoA thioester hydrolase